MFETPFEKKILVVYILRSCVTFLLCFFQCCHLAHNIYNRVYKNVEEQGKAVQLFELNNAVVRILFQLSFVIVHIWQLLIIKHMKPTHLLFEKQGKVIDYQS